jgi:hydrogenase/urease accessory protein HupE
MGAITRTDRARRAMAVVAIVLGATATVLAHDPGLSALDVRVGGQQIVAVLSLAAADAEIVGGRDEIGRLALGSIEVRSNGRSLGGTVAQTWTDESKGVHARLVYERVGDATILVRSAIPARLLPGHRELVSIRGDDGAVLTQRMLDVRLDEVAASVIRHGADPGSTAVRFTALGIEHILSGYDHLLFLAGVLVVMRRWRDVIQTITAFTIAHSLTLAMATIGLVDVPGRIVEPLIAASIVYVGLDNLLRNEAASRWKVTFGFGLVHGLGFASALRDLGIGTSGLAVALPLVSFNAGVEVAQIAVSLLLVPLFWKLSARPLAHVQFASAGSLLVALAGACWLVGRLA